jgi:hypothetical protein
MSSSSLKFEVQKSATIYARKIAFIKIQTRPATLIFPSLKWYLTAVKFVFITRLFFGSMLGDSYLSFGTSYNTIINGVRTKVRSD